MIQILSVHPLDRSTETCGEVRSGEGEEVFAPVKAAEERLVAMAEAAAAEISGAADLLRRAVLTVGLQQATADPQRRRAVAARLYWQHPNVAVGDIVSAFGFGTQKRLLAAVGPVSAGVGCRECGTPLQATSRSHLREIRQGPARSYRDPRSCDACRRAEALGEEERHRREEAAWDSHRFGPGEAWREDAHLGVGGLRIIR